MSNLSNLEGVFPYIVTPVNMDGSIRTNVLHSLCNDLIKKGVHGLAVLGSTGEFAYLNSSQKEVAVATAVQAARGRVPVIAGVSSTSTLGAVRQAAQYKELGVDAIIAVIDSYFPLTKAEVESYFLTIADSVDIPIVIYTNPNFQKTDLSIETIVSLSKHVNIKYLKDASSNTGRLLSILTQCDGNLDVFAASSHIPVSVLMLGGRGWMAGPACLVPEHCVDLFNLCKAGQWEEAMVLQKKLWPLNEVFNRFNLAACVKAGLSQQGYDAGAPIAPQSQLTANESHELREVLNTLAD